MKPTRRIPITPSLWYSPRGEQDGPYGLSMSKVGTLEGPTAQHACHASRTAGQSAQRSGLRTFLMNILTRKVPPPPTVPELIFGEADRLVGAAPEPVCII